MNPDLRVRIEQYIESLFVDPDPVLAQNLADAESAGLPQIQVSPNQGRLLYLLTKISGARRVLEIGTLGGYSTTWFARALADGGTVTTLEVDRTHAEVARRERRSRRRRGAGHDRRRRRCSDHAAFHRSASARPSI